MIILEKGRYLMHIRKMIEIVKVAKSFEVSSLGQLEVLLKIFDQGAYCKVSDLVESNLPSDDPTYRETYNHVRQLMAGERHRRYNGKFLLQYGDDKTIFLTRRGESLRFHIDKILKKERKL